MSPSQLARADEVLTASPPPACPPGRSLRLAARTGVICVALVGWAGLARVTVAGRQLISGPLEAVQALHDAGLPLWGDLLVTLGRAGAGLALGLVLGVVMGLAVGAAGRLTRAADGLLDFARSIPPVMYLPIFLLALGFTDTSRVLTVALGVSVIVAAGVSTAMQAPPSGRKEQLLLAGASWWQVLRWTQPFEALPALLVSTRVAMGMAVVIATVTELVATAPRGIGARVLGAQIAGRTDELTACLVALGLSGWLAGRLFTALAHRLNVSLRP